MIQRQLAAMRGIAPTTALYLNSGRLLRREDEGAETASSRAYSSSIPAQSTPHKQFTAKRGPSPVSPVGPSRRSSLVLELIDEFHSSGRIESPQQAAVQEASPSRSARSAETTVCVRQVLKHCPGGTERFVVLLVHYRILLTSTRSIVHRHCTTGRREVAGARQGLEGGENSLDSTL